MEHHHLPVGRQPHVGLERVHPGLDRGPKRPERVLGVVGGGASMSVQPEGVRGHYFAGGGAGMDLLTPVAVHFASFARLVQTVSVGFTRTKT